MSHVHTHNKTVLKYSLLLIAAFMLVEIAGGLLTNSLALLPTPDICSRTPSPSASPSPPFTGATARPRSKHLRLPSR